MNATAAVIADVRTDDRCLVRVSADGGVTLVADLSGYTSPPINDLVIDLDGASSAAAEDLLLPNGMVFLDRGRTLVVAESLGARLTGYTVAAGGSLTNRRLWAQMPGDLLPERICADADGAIWVASATITECVRVVEGGDVVDWVRTGWRGRYRVHARRSRRSHPAHCHGRPHPGSRGDDRSRMSR